MAVFENAPIRPVALCEECARRRGGAKLMPGKYPAGPLRGHDYARNHGFLSLVSDTRRAIPAVPCTPYPPRQAVAVRVKSRTGHVRCKAFVQDKLTCEADIKFMLVDAEPV